MSETNLRLNVSVIGRDQLKTLRQDLIGVAHAATQVAKTPVGRVGEELQRALAPFKGDAAPAVKKFLDSMTRDLTRATGVSEKQLQKLEAQARDLAQALGPGALSDAFLNFAGLTQKAMRAAGAEITRIDDAIRSDLLSQTAGLTKLQHQLASIKTPVPKEIESFAKKMASSVALSGDGLKELKAQAEALAKIAPTGPLQNSLELLATKADSAVFKFSRSMDDARKAANQAFREIARSAEELTFTGAGAKIHADVAQMLSPGGKKTKPGAIATALKGLDQGIDISTEKMAGLANRFDEFAQDAHEKGLAVADDIAAIGDAFHREAAKLRAAKGGARVSLRDQLTEVIGTLQSLTVEAKPAAAAVSQIITDMNAAIAAKGNISVTSLEKLRTSVRGLTRDFPGLAARLNPVTVALEKMSEAASKAPIGAQRLAATTLETAMTDLIGLATTFERLDPVIQAPIDNAIKKVMQLDEALNSGRATALSFTAGINATGEALNSLGAPTDDESEAQTRLRLALQQTNEELKKQQRFLKEAENQELRRKSQARGHVPRSADEGIRLKAFQSIMQGFIMGTSLLQGQLMFAAFSFVFANFVFIRLMLTAAALTLVLGGLQKAFKKLAGAVISAGSQLTDLIAKLRMVTGSVAEANAAFNGGIQIARKWNLELTEVSSGLIKLRNSGLLIRPLVDGIASAAAGMGLTFDEVASTVISSVGLQEGSLEGLNDLLGIQAYEMANVSNEADRMSRASTVADALNAKFANAASTRARTLTGAFTGLKDAVKLLFGLMGMPFVQDILIPLVNGLKEMVVTITDTARAFMGTERAAKMWGEVLANLRKAFDLLFPTQEKFNDQTKNRTVAVMVILLRIAIMTSRALVILAASLRFAAKAVQFFWSLIKPLRDALRALFSLLKSLIDPSFLQALKNFFLNLPGALLGGLNNLLEAVDMLLPAIIRGLDNFIGDLNIHAPNLRGALDNILRGLDNFHIRLTDDIVPGIGRRLGEFIDNLKRLPGALDSARRDLPEKLRRFGDDLADLPRRLREEIIPNLRTQLDEFLERIRSLPNALDELAREGGPLKRAIAKIGEALDVVFRPRVIVEEPEVIIKTDVGDSIIKSLLSSLDTALRSGLKGSGFVLKFVGKLLQPSEWLKAIKRILGTVNLPGKVVEETGDSLVRGADNFHPTKFIQTIVGKLFSRPTWRGVLKSADSGWVLFIPDFIGSLIIDAVVDNPVWRGVAQVIWGGIMGAIAGAIAGAAVGGVGAIPGAIVGFITGALLSAGVEIGFNPDFRSAALEFGGKIWENLLVIWQAELTAPIEFGKWITGIVVGAFTDLLPNLGTALDDIRKEIEGWVGGLDDYLTENFKPWKWIKEAVTDLFNKIVEWLGKIWGSGFITEWMEGLAKYVTDNFKPWNWIWKAVTELWTELTNVFTDILENPTKGWKWMWNQMKTVAEGFAGFFSTTIPGWFSTMYNAILGPDGALTKFKTGLIGVFQSIKDSNIFRQAVTHVMDPFRVMRNGLQKGIEGVISFANSTSGAISDIAGAIGVNIGKLNLPVPQLPDIPIPYARGGTHKGGLALLGEQGPELAMLPKGTQIIPSQASALMLAKGLPAIGGFFGDMVKGAWDVAPDFLKDSITEIFKKGAEVLVDTVFSALGVRAPDLTLFGVNLGSAMFNFLKHSIVDAVKDGFSALGDLISGREASKQWVKPLDQYTVTQEFGKTPFSGIYASGLHGGIDLAAPTGTSIKSARSGQVAYRLWLQDYGKMMVVMHDANTKLNTLYAHMNDWVANAGDQVSAGQVIGKVGSTGMSTGPHLHFEVRENQNRRNPRDFINFALGGLMKRGGWARVGEQGEEMVYLPGGAQVLSNSQASSLTRNVGGNTTIVLETNVQAGSVVGSDGMNELADIISDRQARKLRSLTRFDLLR